MKIKLPMITIALLLAIALVATPGQTAPDPEIESAIAEATAALDEFMFTFNNRDPEAWAGSLNYPHVRFASGTVTVFQTKEEFAANMNFETFAQRFGWDHSHWLTREVVSASPDKVHFATVFQRFNDKNEPIATFESLYIVTNVDGHWGTQARSSFAP